MLSSPRQPHKNEPRCCSSNRHKQYQHQSIHGTSVAGCSSNIMRMFVQPTEALPTRKPPILPTRRLPEVPAFFKLYLPLGSSGTSSTPHRRRHEHFGGTSATPHRRQHEHSLCLWRHLLDSPSVVLTFLPPFCSFHR